MDALGPSDRMLRMRRQFAFGELVEPEPSDEVGDFDLGVGAPGSYPDLEKVISIKKDPGGPFLWIWRPQGDSNPCYRRERAVS